MKPLTLKQKLWVPILLCWSALLAFAIVNALEVRSAQMAARRVALANVVDMSMSIVLDYAKQAAAGKLPVEDAKQQAISLVSAQRYGANGYVSIIRDDKVLIDNPLSPQLNGRDMSLFRDAKGALLYQEIVDAGNSAGGSGYLRYWWPKPGKTMPSEKVSYVKRFAPWHWNLIAGDYMDDIQAEFYATLEYSVGLLVLLGGLASLIAVAVRKRAEAEIERLAFFDELTGLPNRRLLFDRIENVQAASTRDGSHGALLFLDLNGFKHINDSLGHEWGDRLLVQVATRLRACLRVNDTAARLGGDEFVAVLGNLASVESEAAEQVETVLHRVLESLGLPYELDGKEVRSTPSIGIALFQGNGQNAHELLQRADLAMYKAKAQGRNVLPFFNPTEGA